MATPKKVTDTKIKETKKISTKPDAKRLTSKPEPKKISVAPPAKQIASKPAPKQIEAKAPAKKIATKKVKQLTDKPVKAKKQLQPVAIKTVKPSENNVDNNKRLKKDIAKVIKFQLVSNDEANAEAYLYAFHTMEQVLVYGQNQELHSIEVVGEMMKEKAMIPFVEAFFQIASLVLPKFMYRDVVFYEDFVYELCSQFDDIYWNYEQALQIDIANLFIQHQDYQRGDVNYGYLLRENGIRDKIYYHFVKVYEHIDLTKAKGLAYEANRYTVEQSPYYEYIQQILAS